MPNRLYKLLILFFLQGFPPLVTQVSPFLRLYLSPPRIQPLFLGLVGSLVLHFLHPVLLQLRVLASRLIALLL